MTDITSHIIESVRAAQTDPVARQSPLAQASPLAQGDVDALKLSAQKLEATFLAEMLKHTGVAEMPEGFNGGPGEEAFSGFLLQEYSAAISRSKSIGLADQIYRSLVERVQP